LYPVWYVVVASLSDSNLLVRHSGLLLQPLGFSWDAYVKVFKNPMIVQGYMNTLFVLGMGLLCDMTMTCLGAYFLSRPNLMFKKPVALMITISMFFSGGMIPTYLNMKDLGLTQSLWGLIIPFMITTRNMIILRTSFEAIPNSLVEAAEIDGAGHLTVLWRVILPLSKAMLAVIALYYGVGIWNGWFWASAILRDRSMYPLQVVLREILLANSVSNETMAAAATDSGAGDKIPLAETVKYATIMVATLPELMVYPFLQKYFVKGVMIGAIKG
jgi:putative aldouronate transport system permease protein